MANLELKFSLIITSLKGMKVRLTSSFWKRIRIILNRIILNIRSSSNVPVRVLVRVSGMGWKYSEHLLVLREREQSVGLLHFRQNDNVIFLVFNNNKSERSRWEKEQRRNSLTYFEIFPTTRKERLNAVKILHWGRCPVFF